MKVIILAGGGGTRLFPLSRTSYPKQFLKLGQKKSLLEKTIERFLELVPSKDIIVVTNSDYYYHVKAELEECKAHEAHVLKEPLPKNTAPAIALAARYCIDEIGCDLNEVLLVAPADHVIEPQSKFVNDINKIIDFANEDKIFTVGIKPNKPEMGYGYIRAGRKWKLGFNVDEFVEKPNKENAQKYYESGSYYWNSGMYVFNINTFFQELNMYQPTIYDLANNNHYSELFSKFNEMPNISIDYAIAEKSKKVVMVPIDLSWNDIGSWDAIYEVMNKDENGNVKSGDCLTLNCSNSFIMGNERLVVGIGIEDTIIVETDDVIVVAKKGESQKVKNIVDEIREKGRKEADEHTVGYRPWGNYQIIVQGTGYKVKKITVLPGHSLSLQLHYHRSEHWVVIKGTAKVTIEDENKLLSENESIYINKHTKHRLENPGKIPLEIIEVQNGNYLSEDDIIRYEDIYDRE